MDDGGVADLYFRSHKGNIGFDTSLYADQNFVEILLSPIVL